MWFFNQKMSGLVFVKPNISTLKYGHFHWIYQGETCGHQMKWFVDKTLPYVGVSPDRILLFSCSEKARVEVNCPYSINYTKPSCSNLEYLRFCDGKTVLKKSHKYPTVNAADEKVPQWMLQMALTRTTKNYFVIWTPHGMIIDEIYFDNEFWCSMKNKFQKYYVNFFKVFFQWVESCFYLRTLLFGTKLLKHKHPSVFQNKHEIWLTHISYLICKTVKFSCSKNYITLRNWIIIQFLSNVT